MAKGKKQDDAGENRSSQTTGYRLRAALLSPAELLAERRAYTMTDLVNEAVRKELEREGMWPPNGEPLLPSDLKEMLATIAEKSGGSVARLLESMLRHTVTARYAAIRAAEGDSNQPRG